MTPAPLPTPPCLLPGRFLFVDHITALDAGRTIEGSFTVPAEITELSPCLVAEAIGQLAAWAAMAHAGFARRPVAALAGAVDVRAAPRGGQCVELIAEIDRGIDDAVSYGGAAHVDGLPVVTLSGCVGAMLPMADFDAAPVVRERFEVLCGARPAQHVDGADGDASACGSAFHPQMSVDEHVPGVRLRARLRVPAAASFFADHFPRLPVFPATLLLHAQLQVAAALHGSAQPGRELALPASVRDVKLRSFVAPGQELELCADAVVAPPAGEVALMALAQGRRICTARWRAAGTEER
jgi:3-hydroxymyristoyl/3-hydroxydecanoyl-(acyl carrier protein) dehydratase